MVYSGHFQGMESEGFILMDPWQTYVIIWLIISPTCYTFIYYKYSGSSHLKGEKKPFAEDKDIAKWATWRLMLEQCKWEE